MSSTIDSIIYHPLERAIQQDLEDDQDYAGRHIGEMARFDLGFNSFYEQGVAAAIAATGGLHQAAGLALNGSGTDVVVSRGYLLRVDAANPSAIGALDSPARVGVLLADLTIPIPNPGSNIYFLVQATVSESISSENRDIFNTVSQTYDPPALITKRKTHGITITLKQGTATQIPAPDANNVAIGAFFKVNAAALNDADLIDMRPLKADRVGPEQSTIGANNSATFPLCQSMRTQVGTSNTIIGRWSAMVNGFYAFARNNAAFVDATTLIHSTDTLTANRWYYIYLGQNPRGQAVSTLTLGRVAGAYVDRGFYANCVVAISSVSPGSSGANASAVSLVRPFEGLTAPAGSMACVGVLLRNSANTGWSMMMTSEGGSSYTDGILASVMDQNSGAASGANRRDITINLATGGPGGERLLPVGAASVSGSVQDQDNDTTGTARQVQFSIDRSAGGVQIDRLGTWLTTVRASKKSSHFDVGISDPNFVYLGLMAFTDADAPVAATTAAIGTGNTWALTFTGFTRR